jgi:hypothetical protein
MQAGGKVAETEKQKKLDPKEPKDVALVMDVDILPEFSFVFRESSNLVRLSDVALQVKAAPTSSLPTFDFSGMVTPNKPASAEVKASSVTPLEFDWAAAGMKAPAQPSGASWTCSTCMLTNPATATGECTVCEAPR